MICISAFVALIYFISLFEVDMLKSSGDGLVTHQDLIEEIVINPNSTVAKDISSIWHNHRDNTICLRWRSGARCPYPSLIGRLSGPGLAILEWQQHHNDEGHHPIGQDDNDESSIVHCGS